MVKRKERTLQTLFDEFVLEKHCKSIAAATIYCYKECFDRFIKETGSEYIDKDSVFKWIQILKSKKMTVPSINHYLTGLRTFINWLIEKEIIPAFKVPMQKVQESKLKIVLDQDLPVLLNKPSADCFFREYRY